MTNLTHNGLFYVALAFVPLFGVRLALLRWVRVAKPSLKLVERVWIAFAVSIVAWVVVVLEVIMPLGFGRSPFWR
jgi:hypothetical protein